MSDDSFVQHLEEASRVVRSWPAWKQAILGVNKGRKHMRTREQLSIDLIERVLHTPIPTTKKHTASVQDLADYANEMRQATPLAACLIRIMRQGEVWDGRWQEVYDELRALLDQFERTREKA